MKIDAFFCTTTLPRAYEKHLGLRDCFAQTCRCRWYKEENVRMRIIRPVQAGCNDAEFQRLRRIHADEKSDTDIYILTDDDCLPPPQPFVDEALAIMERHPEFAILSLMIANANIMPWRPRGYEPFTNQDVMEHVSVGGVRFCRKGALETWPEQEGGPGYDREHAEALRAAGHRVGYFRNITTNHLGEGYSTVWREHGAG